MLPFRLSNTVCATCVFCCLLVLLLLLLLLFLFVLVVAVYQVRFVLAPSVKVVSCARTVHMLTHRHTLAVASLDSSSQR